MTVLRTVRYELDMTQGQLANALSTSQAYVSLIERGGSPLSRKMYDKLRVIAAGRGIVLPANMSDVHVPDTSSAALVAEDAFTAMVQKVAQLTRDLEHAAIRDEVQQNQITLLRRENEELKKTKG